jgi:hypothetical protein
MKILSSFFIIFFILHSAVFSEKKTTSKSEPTESMGKYTVTAKQGLMIRSEPSKNGIVIVKMPLGAKIQVLAFSNEEDEIDGVKAKWAKLKYKKYTGWSFSYYLSKEN